MMMIGATGSGKSTLIDGMVNHLVGVKWEDDFRFKIIDLTADEEEKIGRQVCRLVEYTLYIPSSSSSSTYYVQCIKFYQN